MPRLAPKYQPKKSVFPPFDDDVIDGVVDKLLPAPKKKTISFEEAQKRWEATRKAIESKPLPRPHFLDQERKPSPATDPGYLPYASKMTYAQYLEMKKGRLIEPQSIGQLLIPLVAGADKWNYMEGPQGWTNWQTRGIDTPIGRLDLKGLTDFGVSLATDPSTYLIPGSKQAAQQTLRMATAPLKEAAKEAKVYLHGAGEFAGKATKGFGEDVLGKTVPQMETAAKRMAKAKPVGPPDGVAKEPWQMTKREWEDQYTWKPEPPEFKQSVIREKVYHGSDSPNIEQFFTTKANLGGNTGARTAKLGAFFSEAPDTARLASFGFDNPLLTGKTGPSLTVYEAKLNLRKPLLLDALDESQLAQLEGVFPGFREIYAKSKDKFNVVQFLSKIKDKEPYESINFATFAKKAGYSDEQIKNAWRNTDDLVYTEWQSQLDANLAALRSSGDFAQQQLKDLGYDGIVVRTMTDATADVPQKQYIVFDPENIHIKRQKPTVNHRARVETALQMGEPVPPEVLADYPDLAKVLPKAEAGMPEAVNWQKLAGERSVEKGIPISDASLEIASEQLVKPPTGAAIQAESESIQALTTGQGGKLLIYDNSDDFIRAADPSGGLPPKSPPPPQKPGQPVPPRPPRKPDDIIADIARQATKGEKPEETLLRRYEGALRAAENKARIVLDKGNQGLKKLGYGQLSKGSWIPRSEDLPVMDKLFEALHNPSKVANGEVAIPKGLEDVYKELRGLTNWEEAMRIDFNPNMAKVEDYFYRGWLTPRTPAVPRGSLGAKPSFKKARVGATYREMREAGFEPISWNPYEQERISHLQGTRYRQQMDLVEALKAKELAVTDAAGKGLEGWRTPRVGPAFEGKVFATTDEAGEPVAMYSRRWAVPDDLANRLESLYGTPLNMGTVHVGNRTIDLMKAVDAVTFLPKRFKLFGSFFQQADMIQRNYIGSWTGMVDALQAGKPVEAVRRLAVIPVNIVKIVDANFRPGARQAIRQQLNSTVPIIKGRPGVHMRGIMEAGLSTIDTTIFPAGIDDMARIVATENGLMGNAAVKRAIGSLESAMRRGLFEGTYPAAQMIDIKNNIAPIMTRRYGNLSDEAMNGMIARVANKKYSTIPVSQSVIQNRYMRETLRRLFFSMGESEALLRQSFGAIKGPEAGFWRSHWIGAYLGLIAAASTIHFASTGKPLPFSRWTPISRDKDGPLPIGYNQKFASPDLPIKGKEGLNVTLDTVQQMDTAFRILDAVSFLNSRESVPIRALQTQLTEQDYYGRPIDQVGPGGIYSRTAQLINDMFAPIGVGQAAVQVGLQEGKIPEKLLQTSERGLGATGQLVQTTGVNLRAQYLRDEWAQDFKAYDAIPTDSKEAKAKKMLSRDDYRKKNPGIDAKLFITGQTMALKTDEAVSLARKMIEEYSIDPMSIKGVKEAVEKKAYAEQVARDKDFIASVTDTKATGQRYMTAGEWRSESKQRDFISGDTPLQQKYYEAQDKLLGYEQIFDRLAVKNKEGAYYYKELNRGGLSPAVKDSFLLNPQYRRFKGDYDRARLEYRYYFPEVNALLKFWESPGLDLLTPQAQLVYDNYLKNIGQTAE